MKLFAMAVTVFLAVPVFADDENIPPTRVRPLEVQPVVGRKTTTLYDPERSAKVPSILHVWATWCAPCRRELPDMMEFSRKEDVPIAAVAWVDEMDSIVRYLAILGEKAIKNRVFLTFKEGDLTSDDAKYWDIGVFPTTLFVNADGTIAKRVEGDIDWKSGKTRRGIRNFLAGKPFEIKEGE